MQPLRFKRLVGAISAAGALLVTVILLPHGTPTPPPPLASCAAPAVVCVSNSGNDGTGARGNLSAKFKTFNGAFQACQSGDIIEVEGGTYPSGDISIEFKAGLTSRCVFRPAADHPPATSGIVFTNAVQIKASHVEMRQMPFRYAIFTPGASGAPGSDYKYGLNLIPPDGSSGSFACISDIVIKDPDGRNFAIQNGVSDAHFIGGQWGKMGWGSDPQYGQGTPDAKSDWAAPAIGGSKSYNCPDSSTEAAPASNITFDRVRFGPQFQGCRAAQYAADPQGLCASPAHPDLLHIFGSVDGLTITNSVFDGAFGMFCNCSPEQAYTTPQYFKNVLFENDIFGDAYPSGGTMLQLGLKDGPGDCTNVIFRNNTFAQSPGFGGTPIIPFVPSSGGSCPGTPTSNGIQFYSNNFYRAANDAAGCHEGSPWFVTWDHNTYETGQACGTNATVGTIDYVTRSNPSVPGGDYHLAATAIAIGATIAAKSATLDYDSRTRPCGAGYDTGAYEYFTGGVTCGAAGITYVGAAGSNATEASGNTVVVTTSRNADVGQTLLVAIQRGGAAGNATGIVFSAGAATCRNDVLLSASAGMEGWSCDVTTQIPSGSTATVTFTNTTTASRIAALELFSGLITNPKDKSATQNQSGVTSHSTGTTAATTQANELVWTVFAFSATGPTLTSVATGFTVLSTQAGSTLGRVTSAYKIVAAIGTQTATGTSSANVNSDAGIVAYKGS